MSETIVLLHGFAGTAHTWDGVIASLARERHSALALDLPGHGECADAERPISFQACAQHVLARAPERFVLCGYSLGGRVALQVALAAPAKVARLVLVSSTAGIADDAQRADRRAEDRRLAEELEHVPFEEFIESWRAQALFAADPPQVRALACEDHRRNRPDALAAVLRGLGTGEMEPLWDRLPELQMPVAVVVGERDEKFRTLGQSMVDLLPSSELIVVSGGHVLPLESPTALATVLDQES